MLGQHLAFVAAVILLFAATPNFAFDPATYCPAQDELSGCICLQMVSTIICEKPITKPFRLTKAYKLDALIIRDTTGLADLKDFDTSEHYLQVNELTVFQTGETVEKYTVKNLADIFRLSTTTIRVETVGWSVLGLDLTDLHGMETVVLTNLTLSEGLDLNIFANEPHLKHLTLRNVAFHSTHEKLIFIKSNLRTLEITNASGLNTGVSFEPNRCYADLSINIRIRNNLKVKSFDFSRLFPFGQENRCNYDIDLSENVDLDENILTAQSRTLLRAPAGSLYLNMRGVRAGEGVNCNCELWQAMNKHANYFHGIYCKISAYGAKKAGFLAELAYTDFEKCTAPST